MYKGAVISVSQFDVEQQSTDFKYWSKYHSGEYIGKILPHCAQIE